MTLAASLFLAAGNVSGQRAAAVLISQDVPKTATVEIVLLVAPGINEEESQWEITYEFRIANTLTLWEAWKQRQLNVGSEQRLGELFKQGSVKKMLRTPENRRVVLQIPLSSEIRERLRAQPREPLKITPGKITAEDIKLSRDQEIKSQNFMFYSVVSVYDAKLKKNVLMSASRTWPFGEYREARFKITLEIHEDGSYSTKSSLPTKIRSN
jgi:hypothetical protein